jgi:hypothetical protein
LDSKELKKIAKTMRELGITHLKTADIELNLTDVAPRKASKKEEDKGEIPHVIEELTSLLKLGDADLIERLFPLPKEEEHELSS